MTDAARFAWSCAKKDLLRRARDPWSLLLWMGIPLVLGGLISLVSGSGAGPKPRGTLLVADGDRSLASRAFLAAFQQKPLSEFFQVESVDEAAGRKRMNSGGASALIVLPEGLGNALLRDDPAKIELVKNPSQRILPRVAQETLSILSDAVFYAQRIAGEALRADLKRLSEGPEPGASVVADALVAGFSVEINRTVERIAKYLFPPVIEVEVVETKSDASKAPTFGQLFFPSMLFMALFFMAQGLSDDVWRERAQGTLRRALVSPQRIGAWLAGKLLAGVLVFAVVAAIALPGGAALFGYAFSALPLAFAWTLGVGAVLYAFMTLLQMSSSTQRGAQLLSNMVVFPATMLGGSFMPFEVMPGWLSSIGRRTPNGWALEELKAVLASRADMPALALGFGSIALCLAVFVWIAGARLRGKFSRV